MTGWTPDPASAAQIAAADPDANVWLVANAGSGKTKVLTDRVARLLLRGVDPQNILCLTYTKAAAAEMQNRLFKRLGAWSMAGDAALRDNLLRLGAGAALPDQALRRARRLFARAIETPGGIRIQTIHSFCAGLLRRFPLEAGVSPAFTELDDRSAALLRAEILQEMSEGPESALFEAVLPEAGERIDDLLVQITGQRADLLSPPDPNRMRDSFDLPAGLDMAALVEATFAPGDAAALAALVPALLGSAKTTDNKAGAVLAGLRAPWGAQALAAMEGVFLTGAGAKAPYSAKIGSFPTKETRTALGEVMTQVEGLMARVEAARPLRLGLAAFDRAMALHRFAHAFLHRYEEAKARRGWLDFDDFITRATALLTDPATAPWVLYRLDGAIDHILVDEAQDTSPAQWRIVAALTEEFTAGQGAREVARSLFVVGDKKQSIYSFQGADVVEFDRWKGDFALRFREARASLQEMPLVHSFRSSRAILSLVDQCFPGELQAALGGAFVHAPFHEALPGRVEIWPPVPKPEKAEPGEWFDPVDMVGQTDAAVVLAGRIAARVRGLIDAGAQIPDHTAPGGFRPLRAGDVLILVQRRGAVFEAIIRACKAEGLPIAGPDRLTLSEELAVRDILALLSFLNTPEDDLALATALRSPLFGWSEQRLYALAHGRKGYLWEALRQSDNAETLAVLHDLRDRAEYLRPYDLIDRLLTRHRGRALLLGRLGAEAADAIDELSQQALAYERAEVPSLTGFLVWMAAGEVEVKRQAEGEGSQIRVMTVHGSKGLEAPVVILPDTADRRLDEKAMILPLAEGVVTWAGRQDSDPPAIAARKAARSAAREAENLRLLYVAMTRAKCWLIVAAAGEAGEGSWHGIIRKGAEAMGFAATGDGGLRHNYGDWPADAPGAAPGSPPLVSAGGQDVALAPLAPPPAPLRLWTPSGLGGEKTVAALEAERLSPVEDESSDALDRGTALHLALQHLAGRPRGEWPALLERLGTPAPVAAEAMAILSDPALDWIFAPGTLAEVELAAPWNGGWIAGAVDRLVVAPDRVTVVDFKSNRTVPLSPHEVPEAYLRQLGAYALALAALYPGRRIETAILWTRLPLLMPLDAGIVSAALARAPAT